MSRFRSLLPLFALSSRAGLFPPGAAAKEPYAPRKERTNDEIFEGLVRQMPGHPHNVMRDYVETIHGQYRQLSNAALDVALNSVFAEMSEAERDATPWPGPLRKDRLAFLRVRAEARFKELFQTTYGVPFSDVYDRVKWGLFIKRVQAAHATQP